MGRLVVSSVAGGAAGGAVSGAYEGALSAAEQGENIWWGALRGAGRGVLQGGWQGVLTGGLVWGGLRAGPALRVYGRALQAEMRLVAQEGTLYSDAGALEPLGRALSRTLRGEAEAAPSGQAAAGEVNYERVGEGVSLWTARDGRVFTSQAEYVAYERSLFRQSRTLALPAAEEGAPIKEFNVGPHGQMPSPRQGMESHHGIMSRWVQEHFRNYDPDRAPAVLMNRERHNATRRVFNEWRNARGGRIDWSAVSEIEIRQLSERMFDAAEVPLEIRAEYYRQLEEYLKTLERK